MPNRKNEIKEIEIKEDELIIDNTSNDYEEINSEERLFNIEKRIKIISILTILITIISIINLSFNFINKQERNDKTNTTNQNNDNDSYTYDTSKLKEITAADIKSESQNNTIVVLLSREGCPHCSLFVPNITEVAEDYGVQIRYINYETIIDVSTNPAKIIDSTSYNTIKNLEGKDSWAGFGETALKGTPYTMFIKNNTIIYGLKGNVDKSSIEEAFKTVGFKK